MHSYFDPEGIISKAKQPTVMHSWLIVHTEETKLKLSESKWDNANPNPLHPNTLLHTMLNTNEASVS